MKLFPLVLVPLEQRVSLRLLPSIGDEARFIQGDEARSISVLCLARKVCPSLMT